MRIFTLLLSICTFLGVAAQTDGYYRVQNTKTQRYITVTDNRGSVNVTTTDADLGSLKTIKGYDKVVSNPASVIYLDNVGDRSYNLKSQGVDTHSIIGYYVQLVSSRKVTGAYRACAQASGMTKYLSDEDWTGSEGALMTTGESTSHWYLLPIDEDTDNYFGITPNAEMSYDGSYFHTLYAAFPFEFASEGMKAYYVTKVGNGMAVWKEVQDGIVPASTPVIIRCASTDVAENKLSLLTSTSAKVSGNLLSGVYFNNSSNKHNNQKAYNPETMRVLGKTKSGDLGFVVAKGLDYIPANTVYLTVAKGTPEELKLVTQAEYDEVVAGVEEVVVETTPIAQGVYSLCGVKLSDDHSALQNAPAGIYIVDGKKVVIRNRR